MTDGVPSVVATIVDCRFFENTANVSYLDRSWPFLTTRVTRSCLSCYASQSGGAVVVATGSYGRIQASQFESNWGEVRGVDCVVVIVIVFPRFTDEPHLCLFFRRLEVQSLSSMMALSSSKTRRLIPTLLEVGLMATALGLSMMAVRCYATQNTASPFAPRAETILRLRRQRQNQFRCSSYHQQCRQHSKWGRLRVGLLLSPARFCLLLSSL